MDKVRPCSGQEVGRFVEWGRSGVNGEQMGGE